jgi:hypothetical protein
VIPYINDLMTSWSMRPARITQVMNLLKLPSEVKEFLTELESEREIRICPDASNSPRS